MNKLKKIFISVLVAAHTAVLSTSNVYAAGIDTAGFKSWVESYLDPIKTILLWAVPIIFAIYLMSKAITYFQNESDGVQQPSYWSSVKKGAIVFIIAMSVDIIIQFLGF